jgi:hypothetical protein
MVTVGAVVLSALPVVILLRARLVVTVAASTVEVRFDPIAARTVRRDEIRGVALDRAAPLVGWGVRWIPGGRAYVATARTGVRLDLADETSLFIGSQQPEALASAIRQMLGHPVI